MKAGYRIMEQKRILGYWIVFDEEERNEEL